MAITRPKDTGWKYRTTSRRRSGIFTTWNTGDWITPRSRRITAGCSVGWRTRRGRGTRRRSRAGGGGGGGDDGEEEEDQSCREEQQRGIDSSVASCRAEDEDEEGRRGRRGHAATGGGTSGGGRGGGPAAPLRDLVALHTSRWGYEDPMGKMYMRCTVLISDVFVYFTAVWVLVSRLAATTEEVEAGGEEEEEEEEELSSSARVVLGRRRPHLLLVALCQPALVLVDHGHFQYNSVSLGLALWSFHCMTATRSFAGPVMGSVLFTLALNFKQMELYHAPAVFAYLLGRCFRRSSSRDRESRITLAKVALGRFATLGMTVVLTFAILWFPFAMYPRKNDDDDAAVVRFHLDGVAQVLRRLFPFQRGIFEGKVANVWCALSVRPFSVRDRIPPNALPLAALCLTLALILPPCWMLFRVGRGDDPIDRSGGGAVTEDRDESPMRSSSRPPRRPEGVGGHGDIRPLLWGAASTSLAFFLASYQVHEKGILIPLAPISLLAADAPRFVMFFSILATWSLWPLLVIDRLTDAYVCCLVIFLCIDNLARMASSESSSFKEGVDIFSDAYVTRYVPTFSCIVMMLLHLLDLLVSPPHHLPDLFLVLWSLVGCGVIGVAYLGTLWAMVKQTSQCKKQGKMQQNAKRAKSIPLVSILGGLLLSCPRESEGFLPPSACSRGNIRNAGHMKQSSSLHGIGGFIITQDLIDRARLPLEWERRNAQEAKPILNLSARDSDSLSPSNETKSLFEDDGDWISGHLWQVTEQHLLDMGIPLRDETTQQGSKLTSRRVLTVAPQLLRLPTSQIVEAVSYLLAYPCGANSTAVIEADPSFLAYLADDLQYGLEEYLPNMMFMGNSTTAAQMIETQLQLSPTFALQLIQLGVDGGLEERVSNQNFR